MKTVEDIIRAIIGGLMSRSDVGFIMELEQRRKHEVNHAAILRLLDEADDIVNALYLQGANKDYKCKKLREKLRAIEKELTGYA